MNRLFSVFHVQVYSVLYGSYYSVLQTLGSGHSACTLMSTPMLLVRFLGFLEWRASISRLSTGKGASVRDVVLEEALAAGGT
jgi:hypothetical protein